MQVSRSHAVRQLWTLIISNFEDHQLGLAPLALAAGPLKDMLTEAFANAVMFKLKASITWMTFDRSNDDGELHEYTMNFTPINVRTAGAPLGGGGIPRVTALLQTVRQAAMKKMEVARTNGSALTFHSIKKMRFTMVPHPREMSFEERWGGVLPPELADGGCTVKMPKALIDKHCCLNIQNKDEHCFRYCLIAWSKGTAGDPNAVRPTRYLRNAPCTRGRLPKDFVPEFDDGDLDFSMLTFPVSLDSITLFEEANNIGIYVFGWCQAANGGFARLVRTPHRIYEREVQLVLHKGHYLLVTRFNALMCLGDRQKDQHGDHVCHRCIRSFRKEANLRKHLAAGRCLTDEALAPVEPTLPKPRKDEALPYETFRKVKLTHDVPIVVYADFETFQNETSEQRGAKTSIQAKMNGVASFGYYIASRVPSIPSRLMLERNGADAFVLQMLQLSLDYRHACKHPVEIKMTAEDYEKFDDATCCYMCERPSIDPEGFPVLKLVKDHDHFTGAYRGAACQSCNVKAQCPKNIVVMFHNMEGFDAHEIVHAICRLRNDILPPDFTTGKEEEANDDDDDDEDDKKEEEELAEVEGPSGPIVDMKKLSNLRFSILANSTEKFMEIRFGAVIFRDTFKFADASLDKLIKSQRAIAPTLEECFPILSSRHPFLKERRDAESLDLFLRKVPMAYSSIRDESYFTLPAVLDQKCYDNDLSEEPCSDKDYELVKHVVDHFKLRDQGDYHDLYLYTDVLTLADTMETMRAGWRRHCGLDLFGSVTLPSASYQAMLKKTGVRMELISDNNGGMEMMKLINDNVRGGAFCIFQPYARANNPRVLPASPPDDSGSELRELHERIRTGCPVDWSEAPANYVDWCKKEGYDPEQPVSWIVYVDANSLYPTTMCMPLPIGDYRCEALPEQQAARISTVRTLMDLYTDDAAKGYLVEVSFRVPQHLHDTLDYAPVAKRTVELHELSEYQRTIAEKLGATTGTEKLIPDLGVHRKVLYHIGLLKFWVEMGVEIFEVHSMWSWRQSTWMMDYIIGMARQRATTKDPVLREIIKKAMNSLYGKMLQDKTSQRNLLPFTSAVAFVKACGRENFVDSHIVQMDDGPGVPFFGLVERRRTGGIVLDSPRAAGFTILELSKLVMLRVHYKFFKATYADRAKLLFTDTDSLCYCIEAPNPLGDMLRSKEVLFDLISAFEECEAVACSPEEVKALKAQLAAMKGRLGALKLENETSFILEFIGLASKMYSLQMIDRSGHPHSHMKGKGVPKRVLAAKANHEHYKDMLFEPHASSASFHALRSHNHIVERLYLTKKMLTAYNEKVHQYEPLRSRPLGHWRNAAAAMPRSAASVGSAAASSSTGSGQ
jgi:hypothetical protein